MKSFRDITLISIINNKVSSKFLFFHPALLRNINNKVWMGEPARLGCQLWVWVAGMSRMAEAFAAAVICTALPSTWVIVFDRGLSGLIEVARALDAARLGPAKLFFRARLWPGPTLVAES
jgi:hypothetical protein